MNGHYQKDEQDVIQRCLAGERDIFSELVDRYRNMAFTIAYRMVGDVDKANDLAQDGFVSAYRNLRSFRFGSRFSTWLCSIVVNKCRDHLRAERGSVSIDDMPDLRTTANDDPERMASAHETGARLQQALNELPPDYREVLVLKHVEGREYEEIARILAVSVGTLKVRAHRGREMLRNILERSGVRP
jgi:RNA polymerase sigma-70 factor (ECF subfamily)